MDWEVIQKLFLNRKMLEAVSEEWISSIHKIGIHKNYNSIVSLLYWLRFDQWLLLQHLIYSNGLNINIIFCIIGIFSWGRLLKTIKYVVFELSYIRHHNFHFNCKSEFHCLWYSEVWVLYLKKNLTHLYASSTWVV